MPGTQGRGRVRISSLTCGWLKMVVWFWVRPYVTQSQLGWEVTAGGLRSNILLKVGSAVRPDQVAQSFVRSTLVNLQGWRWHSLPRTLLYCCSPAKKSHLNYKCVFSPVSSVPVWFCLEPVLLRATHSFLWLNLLIKHSNLLPMQHWDCIHLSMGAHKQWIFFAARSLKIKS